MPFSTHGLSTPKSPERDQTDDSLRTERDKVDDALAEDLDILDATADAVVSRARGRADAVLASARTKTDQLATTERPPEMLKRSRAREDEVLQSERAHADDVLRIERADHVALLSHAREDTDRDLSHERARSDHALIARDDFMGIVSHELQNMLTVVRGSAAMIETRARQGPGSDQMVTHAQRIQRAGGRMHRLIGDLVDVVSIEAGMLAAIRTPGDPALIVREAIETFETHAAHNGVSLVTEIILPLPPVVFDAARLLQVLANLLGNALKFTPTKGRVVVRVEQVDDDIRFSVSDTGIGIPADKLDAVFERFVQLDKNDRRGVGLGLYIAKCIVEGHAGRMWAESSGGNGTTFCFTLPAFHS